MFLNRGFQVISKTLDIWRMAEADDYESLPGSAPFHIVATAGALAGVAEHCVMYPMDSIKVKKYLQTKFFEYNTLNHNIFEMYISNMTFL